MEKEGFRAGIYREPQGVPESGPRATIIFLLFFHSEIGGGVRGGEGIACPVYKTWREKKKISHSSSHRYPETLITAFRSISFQSFFSASLAGVLLRIILHIQLHILLFPLNY